MEFVKKYAIRRDGKLEVIADAISYHLYQFNKSYLQNKREEESDSEDDYFESAKRYLQQMNKDKFSNLLREEAKTMVEFTACIEILEIMIGKRVNLKRAKFPSASHGRNVLTEQRLMTLALQARDTVKSSERRRNVVDVL